MYGGMTDNKVMYCLNEVTMDINLKIGHISSSLLRIIVKITVLYVLKLNSIYFLPIVHLKNSIETTFDTASTSSLKVFWDKFA